MFWPLLALLSLAALAAAALAWRHQVLQLRRELETTTSSNAALTQQQHDVQAEAEARQLTLLDSMIEGVLLIGPDGRIQLANQALLQLFGVSGNIRGRTLLEAFRLEGLKQATDRALTEGRVLSYELELPGIERRSLQLNAAALPARNGQRPGVILVCHDLTRLKQLENTRRDFVANVSHELRTPLSLIKGYTETLLTGAKDDPAVATRFLQTIEKHADRLTYLIEDLLTLSRLESGQIVMNIQPAPLRPIAADVLNDLQVRAQDKDIRLTQAIPDELVVRADADRLQQVLFNLVDNAIKYGRPGGRVDLSAHRRTPTQVEIQVRDDGPGIPAESLLRIFERFYRVDKARSREQGGTGLGLSIVKHIVQAHGGEVWVQSEPGQGATFHFTLPTG